MATARPALSPAEWKVMQIVWRLSSGAARDIYQVAEDEHGMAPSSVKTLLRRLADKGHLKTKRVGNCFVYRPTRSRLSMLCAAADRLLEHARGEGAGRVLAHMIENSRMSSDELTELRALLDRHAPAETDDDDRGDGDGDQR